MEQTVELVRDKDISNEQEKSARWYAGLYWKGKNKCFNDPLSFLV